jgi:hypothetical protein
MRCPFDLHRSRDPESFYLRSAHHRADNELQFECTIWRNSKAAETFQIELGIGAVKPGGGSVDLKIYARNLTDFISLMVPIRLISKRYSTYEYTTELVDALSFTEK